MFCVQEDHFNPSFHVHFPFQFQQGSKLSNYFIILKEVFVKQRQIWVGGGEKKGDNYTTISVWVVRFTYSNSNRRRNANSHIKAKLMIFKRLCKLMVNHLCISRHIRPEKKICILKSPLHIVDQQKHVAFRRRFAFTNQTKIKPLKCFAFRPRITGENT